MPTLQQTGDSDISEKIIDTETLLNANKLSVGKGEEVGHYLKRITHLTLNGTSKKKIQLIQGLDQCPNLKVLYLYDNAIEKIKNLEFSTQLTHLHLQNNRLRRIENLENLVHLEKL